MTTLTSMGRTAHYSAAVEQHLQLLRQWTDRGWLRELDYAFVRFLADHAGDTDPLVLLAAALASHQLGRGHVCLDLADTLKDSRFALSLPPEGEEGEVQLPEEVLNSVTLQSWQQALAGSELVTGGQGSTPLVLVSGRLYLRCYWQYEQDVRSLIQLRLQQGGMTTDAERQQQLRQRLDVLFPAQAASATDWQKVACALAAGNAFSIITGGPGTGKTTTVVKLLALLQSLSLQSSQQVLRIRLAAPTGKAAARLNESIAGALARLDLRGLPQADEVRQAISGEATTLHRLLGSRPDTRHFVHHQRNPLSLDVLVVDEASMVDLEMMASLLQALPARARLILLGDKDQLASVEAGAVLGELCRRARDGHYLPSTRQWLQAVTGEQIDDQLIDASGDLYDQAVVMLRHSHRFTADSGIGQLAEAVNDGQVAAVRQVWKQHFADLARMRVSRDDDSQLAELVVNGAVSAFSHQGQGRLRGDQPLPAPVGYRHYLNVVNQQRPALDAGHDAFDHWARQVLRAHGQFQVLCALRRGPWGIEGLNQRIAELLQKRDLLRLGKDWYPGRPVLVTKNDYSLGLMNGDIGITLMLPGERINQDGERYTGWVLRVAFPAGDGQGGIKWILPSRLKAVETVFAMTVHKSQGSEFTHTALILPETLNPILTRELVYTGITRARDWFTLASAGSDAVLHEAVERRVQRASGLRE